MISDYLNSLAGALSFDRSLSQRVRQEIEDHLREAVAADPIGCGIDAERRAIVNFGDPRVIAAQFALIALTKQTRRVGSAVILVIAGIFTVMKARLAWYCIMECAISDDIRAVSTIVGAIDRYSFWLSVIIGIAGWTYISCWRSPAAFSAFYRKRLRRFVLLCDLTVAAVVISVISDGVLTVLRLPGMEFFTAALVPVFSMAIEIACAGVLMMQIRGVTQRAMSTAVLSET